MPIDDIRMQQRSQQTKAIESRREAEGVVRIGDRDPITGRYQVLEPNGGVDVSGVKVFNSQEQYGDRVLPFRRNDGTIALDSEKGSHTKAPTAFPKCPGYLASQVFNCEVPPPVKKEGKIWILFLHQHRLYVGGHRQEPEMIYDPIPAGIDPNTALFALPPIVQTNIRGIDEYASIWGDDQGWEASYGIYHPIRLVGFATPEGGRNGPSYARADYRYGSPEQWTRLGKGLFIRSEEIFFNENVTGGNQNSSHSWKNTIADFDGAPKGYGLYSVNATLTREVVGYTSTQAEIVRTTSTYSQVETESYPGPYSNKGKNLVFTRNGRNGPFEDTSTETKTNSNSFQIFYRDRIQALFYRINSQDSFTLIESPSYSFSSSYSGTVDYLMSNGKKDTILFSIPGIRDAGAVSPKNGFHPTFNFPVITDLDDPPIPDSTSTKYKHLDSEREYKVRVYDVYSKSSLIDGAFAEATLSAWGIPTGSRVISTASYVS